MEDKKLIPAHVFYLKWFIRIRWVSVLLMLICAFTASRLLHLGISDTPLYILCAILLILNVSHLLLFKRIINSNPDRIVPRIKKEIHFQIVTDLIILTIALHFSGGIENPLIMFYFVHMIIACTIFNRVGSFIHFIIAILLVGILTFSEAFGIIPHHPISNWQLTGMYNNPTYLTGAGMIYLFTSVLIVGLTHLVKNKSLRVEETYIETNQKLMEKDKLQNQYVLRVTHDIKGHLAAITSRLSVVKSKMIGPLNPEQIEFVDRAYSRTLQLSGFVQEILSLSRKRLMKESENELFSLKDTIDKVISRITVLAADKSIVFSVYIDKSINQMEGNPITIEELFSNLLRNSIFYTPRGGQIGLAVKSTNETIITEITDSGIGIPKDEIPKIFDEFYRGSNAKKTEKSGSGLGLSIAKQIVENHKGKIKVDSEPGVWTKFTLSLPKYPDLVESKDTPSILN